MENGFDIKKEWNTPSLEKLEVTKTLGGDLDDTESLTTQPGGANPSSGG
jgi:hypothetical protein